MRERSNGVDARGGARFGVDMRDDFGHHPRGRDDARRSTRAHRVSLGVSSRSESTLTLFKTRGLLDRVVRERQDADGAVGGDLLAASRDSSRKYHEWPDPISRDDVFDRGRESTEDGGRESTEDVAASVALAQRTCVELFDVDVFARRPRTCAACFRLTTDPKRCSRCRAKIYCSVACQRLDWPEHARECAPASRVFERRWLERPRERISPSYDP